MTTPAQRHEIGKIVVSCLSWLRCAIAINVMNVKVFVTSAMLACVFIALKCGLSIAAKGIVVFGFLRVAGKSLFIRSKPFMYFAHFMLALAFTASLLRPRPVNKIISTRIAHKNSPNRCFPVFSAKHFKVRSVLLGAVVISTVAANFLSAARWFKRNATNYAVLFYIPTLSFTMNLESARLASLHVWGAFINHCCAVWASQFAVFFHTQVNLKLNTSNHNI